MLPSSLSDIHPFVLALFVLAAGFSIRRIALRRRRRQPDPMAEAKQLLMKNQQGADAQLKMHEVRLHDIARESEARLRTKMAVMDEMVVQADREIARLEQLLEEIHDIPTPRIAEAAESEFASENGMDGEEVADVNPDQFLRLLRQAGYNAEEIANATNRPLAEVRRILGEPDEGSSRAA